MEAVPLIHFEKVVYGKKKRKKNCKANNLFLEIIHWNGERRYKRVIKSKKIFPLTNAHSTSTLHRFTSSSSFKHPHLWHTFKTELAIVLSSFTWELIESSFFCVLFFPFFFLVWLRYLCYKLSYWDDYRNIRK